MLSTRTETSIENGIKWVRRYKKIPKGVLQPASPSYLATYKCDLCGHVWYDYCASKPLSEKKCILDFCGNPSFFIFLIREIRRQKNTGYGKAIKIEADLWES